MTDTKYYKNSPEAEEDDEPLFDVSYSPEEGDLVVFVSRPQRSERKRRSKLRRLGTVRAAAATPNINDGRVMGASRAFHLVRRFAVRYDLRTHASLRFDDQTEARRRRRHVSGAMKKIRKQVGPFPYLAVHEQGDVTNHLHWHALLPAGFDQTLIEEAWEHGKAFVTRAHDYEGLQKLIRYAADQFFDEDIRRFFPTRYTTAKGFAGSRYADEGLTKADVDILVQQLAGANYDTVVVDHSPNPFVVATYRWNPPHIPRGQ